MEQNKINPRKALNKAWLKKKPVRDEIEVFKTNLAHLLDSVDDAKDEEYHKTEVRDFLKNTFYKNKYYVNVKQRIDWAIFSGPKPGDPVGVLMEIKKPDNKSEMLATGNINKKALHELVLYYLRERVTANNLEIRHLVATNIYEWFIFDAAVFERVFAQDKTLVRQFIDFEAGRLAGANTDFFYNHIAEPFVAKSLQNPGASGALEYTYLDIRDYEKALKNQDKRDDNKFIVPFKLLSPEHLLKLPFANDSNSLDRAFYAELLHIIGLAETKQGGKKVIGRKPAGKRDAASLLENAIVQLDNLDKISKLPNAAQYGNTYDERLFNVALELAITWVNRILFLKLLESQLIAYHGGDRSYGFLDFTKVANYDDLNSLFFSVLARKPENRPADASRHFSFVPYLNSSLFEVSDVEDKAIVMSNLRDGVKLPLLASTVLKDGHGKRRAGAMTGLEYFFEFLDAYDFNGEGGEDIQEDNKTLINASVLGLIFEKINGYKDGSFFTPGFITMYMCREAIRKAVVQKFNEAGKPPLQNGEGQNGNKLKYRTLRDIYEAIGTDFTKKEANAIINSLKICDPAVGSGHFLVSALNEILAIKSELKILLDRNGLTLRDYHVEVANDELTVTDDDGKLFEYHPGNKESQRVQEALFHEKQAIIENCLFGVDINPNSVKICRLRLWIELLKHAYYVRPESLETTSPVCYLETGEFREGYEPPVARQLQTLPNIDINIKCGNSLISRFPLDADISQALKKSKWTIDMYRIAVQTYREAVNKEQKREMLRLMDDIKNNFRTEIGRNSKEQRRLDKLGQELYSLTGKGRYGTGLMLFEPEKQYGKKRKLEKQRQEKISKIEAEINKLTAAIEGIKSNRIYENAFEWRFEFPEVLDNNGVFVGFDVVMGNPPYIRQEEFAGLKAYLKDHYETYAGTADLYVYFVERGLSVAKANAWFVFILPNKWMRAGYGLNLRRWAKNHEIKSIIDFGDLPVFEEATTYPCIWFIQKRPPTTGMFQSAHVGTLDFPKGLGQYVAGNRVEIDQNLLPDTGWTLVGDKVWKLLEKIKDAGTPLGEYVDGKIFRGVLTGLNEAFVIDGKTREKLIGEDPKCEEIIKPFLAGRDIKRYQQPKSEQYLIFTRRGIDIKNYPSILSHLNQFKERLEPKPKDYKGNDWQGRKPGTYKWYEIQDAVDYYEEFEKPKIMLPDISIRCEAIYDESGFYCMNTAYIIPGLSKSGLGILNSKLILFYYSNLTQTIRGGYFRFIRQYLEQIPIVDTTELETKVSEILSLKKQNPQADTSALEAEIDLLVYKLYGLTEEEIELIR